MIQEYEKKKASLQRQIIMLEFGHHWSGRNPHATSAIEIAKHEIAAIDTALGELPRKSPTLKVT